MHVRILAFDTSTQTGSVAILDESVLVAEHTLNVRTTHSERLLAVVDRLLADAELALGDMSGLAVAVGPGSFTGLRIGISTAKGLAFATGLPVAAVPTLDALAYTLPFASLPVCPVLDAKKGEVYTSLYEWHGDRMERRWEYLALSPEALAERISNDVVFVGDGVGPFREILSDRLGRRAHFTSGSRRLPSAACVAQLGLSLLAEGETVSPEVLAPLYLRSSEAELRRRHALLSH
jgi:tRNA threonylcarbamoyladenosine biosynthesis protein TsaB